VEEFDLFFTHSLKLHLIKPKADNNKINDKWAFVRRQAFFPVNDN